MISSIRTFTIQNGKMKEAIEAFVKSSNRVNSIGGNVHIERNISGPMNQLYIVGEYESLAAWESAIKKIQADEKFLELQKESLAMVVGSPTLFFVERIS